MVNGRTDEKIISCGRLLDLPNVAKKIVEEAGDYAIWLFKGEMGAGKTTLIREVCKIFQVEDNVSSPTFSLVNEYQNAIGDVFYHFDFYRIKDEAEAMDIGCEEYFYSGDICLIEWPSRIVNLIPARNFTIELLVNSDNSRSIALHKNG